MTPPFDTLYFVDGKNNTLVAFSNVTKIPAGGIQAKKNGMEFTGPNASDARIVFSGKPLNGPISTALLSNGNLVIGNTLDPDGQNLMVEIAVDGTLLDVKNVDKGAGRIDLRNGRYRNERRGYEGVFQRRQRHQSASAPALAAWHSTRDGISVARSNGCIGD